MASSKKLKDIIKEMEDALKIHHIVLDSFPDAKSTDSGYTSKIVNGTYTNFKFQKEYGRLYVIPYCIIPINNDAEDTIEVYGSPKRNKLAYTSWRLNAAGKQEIRFCRFSINQKNHNFKDDMLNDCKAQIMKFVGDNPGYVLNTKHLEPRLQKLLMFS